MRDENLVKEQMKVISNLQDKINLLKFDVMQLNGENGTLRRRLKNRGKNIKRAKEELAHMKRTNDFSKVNNVLSMLREGFDDE